MGDPDVAHAGRMPRGWMVSPAIISGSFAAEDSRARVAIAYPVTLFMTAVACAAVLRMSSMDRLTKMAASP